MATAENRHDDSLQFYIKGLHLLLDVLAEGDVPDWPDFVPKVDMFTAALGDSRLPLATLARLMQHYERAGEFAKAEDALFAMIETEPDTPGLIEFGTTFYERLRHHTDGALASGNLPRPELEAGLAELRQRS